jgi:hypothetical protein
LNIEIRYLASARIEENEMSLFQKNLTPADLGARLYETLRHGMESDGELSIRQLLVGLELVPEELHDQYVGEIMIGLLFGATLAIESSATPRVANQIISALKAEFFNHLEEQGARPLQCAEWEAVLANRFLTYRECLEGYTGFEPPWKLGRALFWHIIGDEVHIAMCVKICTLYIMTARALCGEILKQHGPRLTLPSGTELRR